MFFFFKRKTAYEVRLSLVGSEMCIRDSYKDAVERNRKKIPAVHKRLKSAGVKYILSSWIDLHGIPKSKPVPISDFELLCLGKGPQFAVHSISFVPELTLSLIHI